MKRLIAFLLISGSTVLVPSLSADTCTASNCTFTFDVHNVGPTFTSGPYGTVNLALNGSAIDFTIDLADGFALVNTGFPNGSAIGSRMAFAFNSTVGGTLSFGSYSSTHYTGGTPTGRSYKFDGFGGFDYAAAHADANGGGNPNAANVLSFTVNRIGGFNSIYDLVNLNAGGYFFAADVFESSPGCTGDACTGLIGVTSRPRSTVPEPSSYAALLLGGFGALALLRRRKGGALAD
jgi:PEP-CTERM motif